MTMYNESDKVRRIDTFYCPKCKKEKIKHEDITPEKVTRRSMDELTSYHPQTYASDPWMGRKMKATCLGCGYSVEYEKWGMSIV